MFGLCGKSQTCSESIVQVRYKINKNLASKPSKTMKKTMRRKVVICGSSSIGKKREKAQNLGEKAISLGIVNVEGCSC